LVAVVASGPGFTRDPDCRQVGGGEKEIQRAKEQEGLAATRGGEGGAGRDDVTRRAGDPRRWHWPAGRQALADLSTQGSMRFPSTCTTMRVSLVGVAPL